MYTLSRYIPSREVASRLELRDNNSIIWMKLLFLLLIPCHYAARDHKDNEKRKKKLDFAYGNNLLR